MITKLLSFLNHKNSSKLNLEVSPFEIDSNIKVLDGLLSSEILKNDSCLTKLKNDLIKLYTQWGKPEAESMKEDFFYNLDFEVNNIVISAKEIMNNKTYHYSELQNLNKVITNIEIIFKNIYSEYHTNLYHKCIQEILRTLSIIKNRNSFSKNKIPKKWNLESDSLKIINNFISHENNYEGKILTLFSKKFKNDHNKMTIKINVLINNIKEVLSFLKLLNGDTDSLENLKITKFNLYQKFLVYKYCFYKILLFLSEEYPQESDLEEPLSLFTYLFLNNVNEKYEQYYFTLQQIKTKREEEIEEENNQTKNRRANMSEERKQIDNFEQKMNIGFYAKGKFDFKKGFNQ